MMNAAVAHQLDHLRHFVDAKLPYIGAGAGSVFGFVANVTGLTANANSVLVVVISAIGGGFVANLPKLLTIVYKKRMDDQTFISSHYQNIIDGHVRTSEQNAKEVTLQSDARHDIAGGLQSAGYCISYLQELMKEAGLTVPDFKLYDAQARVKQLDGEIRELKGIPKLKG